MLGSMNFEKKNLWFIIFSDINVEKEELPIIINSLFDSSTIAFILWSLFKKKFESRSIILLKITNEKIQRNIRNFYLTHSEL